MLTCRGSGHELAADERAAAAHMLMAAPVEEALAIAYPDVYDLADVGSWGSEEQGKVSSANCMLLRPFFAYMRCSKLQLRMIAVAAQGVIFSYLRAPKQVFTCVAVHFCHKGVAGSFADTTKVAVPIAACSAPEATASDVWETKVDGGCVYTPAAPAALELMHVC